MVVWSSSAKNHSTVLQKKNLNLIKNTLGELNPSWVPVALVQRFTYWDPMCRGAHASVCLPPSLSYEVGVAFLHVNFLEFLNVKIFDLFKSFKYII